VAYLFPESSTNQSLHHRIPSPSQQQQEITTMPTLAVPDMCSPRPREKGAAKSTHYGIRLSNKDLASIDEIQRAMLRRQPRQVRQAVSIPLAIRTAVATYAAQLKREEAKVKRSASPLSAK
jgi:hypothetical protein